MPDHQKSSCRLLLFKAPKVIQWGLSQRLSIREGFWWQRLFPNLNSSLTCLKMYFLYSRCYDRGNRVFCAISCPSKSGIRPDSDPQVVEARKRATALLLTVSIILKETVTERQHFRKSNYSLLQVHDKFRYSDIQINWLWSQSNFIKVYIMDSKVFPFFRVSTRFNKSFVFLGYDYKLLKFFSRVLPYRFYAAPLSLLFCSLPSSLAGQVISLS